MKNYARIILSIIAIALLLFGGLLVIDDFRNNEVRGNITIWANSESYNYLNDSANDFMANNEKAKITVVEVPSYEYEQKIEEAKNNGTLPNIVQVNSQRLIDASELDKGNISIEQQKNILDTYMNSFNENRILEITDNKKMLGIPFTSRPLVMYLRKDVMEQYGYSNTEVINTWSKLIEVGKDIYEKSGGKFKALNAVGSDKEDLMSLLVMQYMEETSDKDEVIKKVNDMYSLLEAENIINTNENGEFFGIISSINGMRELESLEVKCNWTANNVPAKMPGGNRFYVAEGDNLVVINKNSKNDDLTRKFIGDIITSIKSSKEDIENGNFFLSSLSIYKKAFIEKQVNNFSGKSPIVIMANITEKAPGIDDYELYREIKKELSIN